MSKVFKINGRVRRNFAIRLTALRKLKFESATALAIELGVEPQRYMKWEQGRAEPSFEMLTAICQLLDCTPDYLLIGENSSKARKPKKRSSGPRLVKPAKARRKSNG